jgi:ParB/RepB/Spo0J family partition protein
MARRNSIYGISADTAQFVELPIESIQPNPRQPRKMVNEDTLERLAKSIEREGLHQPIVVIRTDDPDVYILGAGQRRLLAHEKLNRQTIPAMIAKTDNPAEIALTENLQREDLHPIDSAAAMAGLMTDYGYTHEQVAEFLGERRTTVTEWLSINQLPEEIKNECRALDIGKTHLVALARLLDRPDEMQELWEQLRAGHKFTTRELQRRQRGGSLNEAENVDIPRELKPVLSATARAYEALKKVKPLTFARHTERLAELQSLHKQIGRLINKLAGESKKVAAPEDAEGVEEEKAV